MEYHFALGDGYDYNLNILNLTFSRGCAKTPKYLLENISHY